MNKKCALKKMTAWLCGPLLSLLLLFVPFIASSQQINFESIFDRAGGISITLDNSKDWYKISDVDGVSIDHGSNKESLKLFVTRKAYQSILDRKIKFHVSIPQKSNIIMKDVEEVLAFKRGRDCMPVMDFYPSYEAYEAMMYAFEEEYPDLCTIVNLGTLDSGRKILAARLGDNQDDIEVEPVVLYTSTMHGDETAGYPLMLQLIDLLLCEYQSNPRFQNILDNITLYINPLANPNGTYRDGNHTVEGAIRLNARFVDLNRNFPDPEDGTNPDGRAHQEETLIFMAFADSVEVDLACNMHGGAEVANYPWDTFEHLHADDGWWEHVCRDYVTQVQENSEEGYFDGFNNGITNGFDWYEVQGGRQDYMNFFHRTREFTLEYTNQKLLDSSRIPEVWQAHKEALVQFIERALTGLHGTVTDCVTGAPVVAEVLIPDHDEDNSSVFSYEKTGAYYRYLDDGIYDFEVLADGYDTVTFTMAVDKTGQFIKDIELCPSGITSTTINPLDQINVYGRTNTIVIDNPDNLSLHFSVYNTSGQTIIPTTPAQDNNPLPNHLPAGVVFVTLQNENKVKTFTVILSN